MSKFWPPAAPHYLEPSYNPAPHDLVLIFETLDGRGVLKTSSNTIEPTVFSFFCPKVPPWMGRVSGLPPGRETPTPNAHTAVVIYWYLVPGTRYTIGAHSSGIRTAVGTAGGIEQQRTLVV